MGYGKPHYEEWELAVLASLPSGPLGERMGRLFLAGEARIAAGAGCPDCGATAGHSLPCAQWDAAQALLSAGVQVPGYMRQG